MRDKKNVRKSRIKLLAFSTVCFLGTLMTSSLSFGAVTLYEKTYTQDVGNGIHYEFSKRVTEAGLLDVYVIKVDLTNPNISVKPVSSLVDVGLKEATSKLLSDSGAVAGVNADFFNMAGTYSWSVGPEIKDGKVLSADRINNSDKNKYASMLIGYNNSPLIDYVKTNIVFLNDGVENIQVFNYNKITDLTYSTYIDRNLMTDTYSIDARFPNTTKIVVDSGFISYISQKGETVVIPENGFIILISEQSADYFKTLVQIGQKAEVQLSANIDLSQIKSGISGAGKLLNRGQIAYDEGYVPKGRQPRTAVGYSPDGRELIVMVVDGRTHSIGATHEEMAHLMLRYGAYEAMHFDGGGSTAMAVRNPGDDHLSLANTPSQGSERKVINALGIFNTSPNNLISAIKIRPANDKVFQYTGLPLQIYGIDQALNTAPLYGTSLGYDDANAIFTEGLFYPSRLGTINLSANNLGLSGQTSLTSLELAELIPEQYNLTMAVREEYPLRFTGRSTYGFFAPVYKGVQYEVVPYTLGFVSNDYFVPTENGAGYIKCSIGNIVTYIDVNVGIETHLLKEISPLLPMDYIGYPANVTGNVCFNNMLLPNKMVIEMNYKMEPSEETQAAYVRFLDPVLLPENAYAIKLSVYGDNSANWLRMKLVDGDGKAHLIDLAKTVDWEGWKEVAGLIPTGLAHPIYIERIYIANLSNPVDTPPSKLYFSDLYTEKIVKYEPLSHEEPTEFYDPLNSAYPFAKGSVLTLMGRSKPAVKAPQGYEALNTLVTNKLNARLNGNPYAVVLAGDSDVTSPFSILNYGKAYQTKTYDTVTLVRMTAAKGGFVSTDFNQWSSFYKDIKNSKSDHIIIQTDKSPLNFESKKEYEYFQEALCDLSLEGKNIFVVSTENTVNYAIIENGIRYLNISALYDGTEVNSEFSLLRFSVDGKNINYWFEQVGVQ